MDIKELMSALTGTRRFSNFVGKSSQRRLVCRRPWVTFTELGSLLFYRWGRIMGLTCPTLTPVGVRSSCTKAKAKLVGDQNLALLSSWSSSCSPECSVISVLWGALNTEHVILR